MILDKKETVIAYRCPKCGKTVMSVIGVFSLSGDLIKLKCDCGESELSIAYTKDNKINLRLPCLFCGGDHSFNVGKDSFFEKGIMQLNCHYTGLEIVFLGQRDKVFEAIKQSDEQIVQIFGDYDPSSLKTKVDEDDAKKIDAGTFDIVNFMLKELEEDGKIKCRCDKRGVYGFEFDKDGVMISCGVCGAKKHFNLESVQRAEDFINTDVLILE